MESTRPRRNLKQNIQSTLDFVPLKKRDASMSGENKNDFKEHKTDEYYFINFGNLLKKDKKIQIAGFDMDWTLIKTKTGKTFAKDANDWLELFPSTKTVIQDLVNSHKFNIVIFTNQAGVA